MKKLTFFIHENGNTYPGTETDPLKDLAINGRHLVVNGEWNEAVANEAIENMNQAIAERLAEVELDERGGLLND